MRLLWLDLETTGLVACECDVLEVALLVADLQDPFNALPVYDSPVWFPASRRPTLDPFVLDMHTKSGLLDACANDAAPGVRFTEKRLLELVPDVASRDDRPTLAGSSVHFDHEFISFHMPELAARLSHRHYDVSSVKLFCESMGMPRLAKAEVHRARPDVDESITHAKRCAAWLKTNTTRGSLDDVPVSGDAGQAFERLF